VERAVYAVRCTTSIIELCNILMLSSAVHSLAPSHFTPTATTSTFIDPPVTGTHQSRCTPLRCTHYTALQPTRPTACLFSDRACSLAARLSLHPPVTSCRQCCDALFAPLQLISPIVSHTSACQLTRLST